MSDTKETKAVLYHLNTELVEIIKSYSHSKKLPMNKVVPELLTIALHYAYKDLFDKDKTNDDDFHEAYDFRKTYEGKRRLLKRLGNQM